MKLMGILQDVVLYEGLIHSQSIDTVGDMIDNWSVAGNKLQIVKRENNSIRINFKRDLTEGETNNLIQLINNLGWFISSYSVAGDFGGIVKKYDYNHLIEDVKTSSIEWLRVEAKYDLELNKYELKDLYHVSPEKYQSKIKKIGLVPKGQGKIAHHPERIYFTTNEVDANFLKRKFNDIEAGTYLIYKIDVDKLRRQNNGIRFFSDPAYIGKGIYTLSNIPPDCITVYKPL